VIASSVRWNAPLGQITSAARAVIGACETSITFSIIASNPTIRSGPCECRQPGRFFRPPYVGGRGWIGVRLDRELDWAEIAELCQDAYRAIAPARLVALLEG
jgi:hypothetical protein